jgi:hypothetical protein
MAMTAGSVTIDPITGAVSGTGAARMVFDDYAAKLPAGLTGGTLAAARQNVADLCNSFAKLIDYVKANAEIDTPISVGGLQNLPATVTAGQPTAAPSSTKHLSGTIT